ncbi:non-ribosomal peptide synthetase [Nocardia australiensis]|uniref:non-ribosomal peptide synthetase n=1 Tax=Nocardia australiensis TaxID=2887191 RepID=UPI001D1588E2|nr:non-ribosomal peptide synthetase [Nocardia australiensis]
MESAQRQGERSRRAWTTDDSAIDRDQIRAAIARQLDVPADTITDDADLIQLGLDSIRTMKLAGAWRKRGIDINFALLAANPTVDGWFELIGGADESDAIAPGYSNNSWGSNDAAWQPDSTHSRPAGGAEDPVTSDTDDPPFALAPMQHAYWIGRSESHELGGVAAHLYVEFDGAGVDPVRLERAVDDLVRRHPMLRTRFLPDGTQQTMTRPGRPVWTCTDLRGLDRQEVERALESLRDNNTHQRMAVEDGQVIDIALTLLDNDRTRLHLDVDMLAADAMSYRILLDDLARLYRGQTLPPQTYTFQRYLADNPSGVGAEHDRDRQWWQQRLPELPGVPELPQASPGPARDAGVQAAHNKTVRYHRWLAPEAKARVFDAAHARGITPAMALASVFAETIGGWSAQRRFLLNLPLFHREPVHPEIDRVVGDFTSSVLLEVDVTEPATVTERARALQSSLHTAGAHTAYAGLEVLRDLGRSRGEPVLAPIVYTSALNLGELFADTITETFGDPVWIISQGPQVLLDAQITEVRGGLLLNWDVRESAFPAGVIEAMFARYIDAIMRLAGDVESADVSQPSAAGWDAEAALRIPLEQAQVRARVNATAGPVTRRLLHTGFFASAATNPDAPALIWEPGGTVSYGRLAAEALAIAGALRGAGVLPGDSVAVQLPKGPDQIVATLGVLAAGAVYVPIGFDQPAARRAEILRTGTVVAALTVGSRSIPEVRTLALAEARSHPEPLRRPIFGDPETIAYVLFTSGSTGKPKGVQVPHRAAMNTIDDLNERFGIGARDRALALSALEFDLSVYDIFGMLSAGGAVVTVDEAQRTEPARWVELAVRHDVSLINCVPSLLDMLLTATGGLRLDALRTVILGGDWVEVTLPGRLAAVAPDCRFAGLGGATETAIHSTICEVIDAQVPADWTAVPYGVPLRNVQCRVVGPTGHDCPDWVTGELWIGGAGVAAGYRGDPERTAERFVVHDGMRWYRTGDLARYRPDGALEFLGRADHQVKIRGYRVELGEVESALRQTPGVHQAIAAVVGAAAPKLVAALVAEPNAEITSDVVLAAVADLLPSYMIPARLEILAHLPLTSNAKPDRAAIRALHESIETTAEFVAASTDLERALADIVATVLETDRVGATDDFFALGGDSVLATTVIARIREWLDASDTIVADLFAARTVAGLAHRLLEREERKGSTGRLEAVAGMYLEVAAMSDDEVLTQV